ncbi:MAG TPA: hypothetical protein ENH82_20240 [bacterium]|nr:hypothetical protein [bacterium]
MIKRVLFTVGFLLVGIVTIITGNARGFSSASHTISAPGLTEFDGDDFIRSVEDLRNIFEELDIEVDVIDTVKSFEDLIEIFEELKIDVDIVNNVLSSPSPVRKKVHEYGTVEYFLPNGFGIDDIRVVVPKGMEKEGFQEAQILLAVLHQKSRDQHYSFKIGKVQIDMKATSLLDAYEQIRRWMKVFGGSL